MGDKLKGLFLNTVKAKCSIHESGKMAFDCLKLSDKYVLDYQEVHKDARHIPTNYDFYVFNYHPWTSMGWLNTKSVKQLPGLRATIVLEVLPQNPFALVSPDDFDAYLVLDPTINLPNPSVYAFPRPLEFCPVLEPYRERDIPVIGSFGLGTIGKGFELVVDAVGREFDRAVVRINIPPASEVVESHTRNLYSRPYPEYLADLCRRVARKGIEVQVTNNYMTKSELIQWCSQNTLNCFLYNRDQPGLSATTDQAVVSGRPLAVSANETFRHLHLYIKPYPYISLREAIAMTQESVQRIQQDWKPKKFAERFERVLEDAKLSGKIHRRSEKLSKSIELKAIQKFEINFPGLKTVRNILQVQTRTKKLYQAVKSVKERWLSSPKVQEVDMMTKMLRQSPAQAREHTVLIVSHKQAQCGIYEYGRSITYALNKSTRYVFKFAECSNEKDLEQAVVFSNPSVIIYNYYPLTMPWLTSQITRKYRVPQLGIMHEVTQEDAEKATTELFDYHLCPDPTLTTQNPIVFKTKRLIPAYTNYKGMPEKLTIGSFGFGFGDKGFVRLIETVQKEFDEAKIVIRMPFNTMVDAKGKVTSLIVADACRQAVKKPGIELIINHEYIPDKKALLDFLSSNTINAFFYDVNKHRGISSTIELALAAQRPVAVNRCGMFRHVHNTSPSICIEDQTLAKIIENGIAPLVPLYNEWSEPQFIMDYEKILDKVLGKEHLSTARSQWTPTGVSGVTQFNRILDNSARRLYAPAIEKIFEYAPKILVRKIQEANVQQAFVFDTVLKFVAKMKSPKILCVGSFEDSASESLRKLGYTVEEIDPDINYDLNTFFHLPKTKKESYDIIFSTSVLEHVTDDAQFMNQIAKLLTPGGISVHTCDYKPTYQPGDPLPLTDLRFYTPNDLKQRIIPCLEGCELVDEPEWDAPAPDFRYAGYFHYTFATLVFRKK